MMRRDYWRRLGLIAAMVTMVGSSPARAQPGFETAFKVIVNVAQAASTIDKTVLADIYRGKTTRWRDGSRIPPVDHSTQSPLRASFTREILGETIPSAMAYWMRQMSTGARPPMVKEKDEDVIGYVVANAGAIAYVAESATLPGTLKVLKVQ